MEETAVIKEKIKNGLYRIEIQADYKHCHSCGLGQKCCKNHTEMLARSKKDYSVGDQVFIEIEESSELMRAVFVFLIPILLGSAAACLSYFIFFPKSALWCFGFFAAFLVLTFMLSGKAEEKMKRFFPYIVKLVDK